ncbi:MAG: SBBP repeat-containing protein, partial [Chloroflexi bacterium]|nr:SBBP repeat-containing protein [Chloroflexota bacterium]
MRESCARKIVSRWMIWILLGVVSLAVLAMPGLLWTPSATADSPPGEEWVARYNGTANSFDGATAMAVDASGNVYVTGASYAFGSEKDFLTIKYGPTGTILWEARYTNGTLTAGDDFARAIATDASGNVYVTGSSAGPIGPDYLTLKYDSGGTLQWAARYTTTSSASTGARALAVDGSGNVYVTGMDAGWGWGMDYLTIRYSPSGLEDWAQRLSRSTNAADYEAAQAVAVDADGNVYVTGTSKVTGLSSGEDAVTVKYDSAASQLWAVAYTGLPGSIAADWGMALAVDGSGNVYVAGHSTDAPVTGRDYFTVKYNSGGGVIWEKRYNGAGAGINGDDEATALVLDSAGNAYVAGASFNNGAPANSDYATVKYDGATGNQLWVARYNGPANGSDAAKAIALDGSGNVYVTGNSAGSTMSDYATVKYDGATGSELWAVRYNGTGNGIDESAAIAVQSGNVYVTGKSEGIGSNYDYATIKYGAAVVPSGPPCDNSWASAVSGLWSDATKWSAGAVPTSTANVCITVDGTYVVTATGSVTVKSLRVGSSGNTGVQTLQAQGSSSGALNLTASYGITNTGTIVLSSINSGYSAQINVTNGVLSNTGTVNVNPGTGGTRTIAANLYNQGTVNVNTDTTLSKLSGSHTNLGAINIATGALLTMSGNSQVFNHNAGTLTTNGFSISSNTFNYNGGVISGTATITLANSTLNLGPGGTGPATFVMQGSNTLIGNPSPGQTIVVQGVAGSGILTSANGFTNGGTIRMESVGSGYTVQINVTNGTLTNT